MSIQFVNTLTKSKAVFAPAQDDHVRLYCCGPTVYDYAHIGNLRSFLFGDLLVRFLKWKGFDVTQIMNITDVDDKTIAKAQEKGLGLGEYTQTYIDAFFEDLKTLNITPAATYPRATEHVAEMIQMIEVLMDKGLAYQAADQSVYCAVQKIKDYGRLIQLDPEQLQAGARVAGDEYEKDHVGDFALWKAYAPQDGKVFWDSPWGKGRPGWHIECSAMSMKYLSPCFPGGTFRPDRAEPFDIHTGGEDNKFPHHVNEMAQSEGATGKDLARFWMHAKFLLVDNKKMSKSLGNFYTLRDLLDKGYDPRAIRYALSCVQYSQPLNFTLEGIVAAGEAVSRLQDCYARLHEIEGGGRDLGDLLKVSRQRFDEALCDDLNMSAALGVVFELIKELNKNMAGLSGQAANEAKATLEDFDQIMGVLAPVTEEVPPKVQELVEARTQARADKDWAASDRIRDELKELGYVVEDKSDGVRVKKI